MKTVGVAPGSYTIQLGAPPCPPDPIGGSFGVPFLGWYESLLATENTPLSPLVPLNGSATPLNPYGTDSELRGLRGITDPSTLLASLIIALPIVGGIFVYHRYKRHHRRR